MKTICDRHQDSKRTAQKHVPLKSARVAFELFTRTFAELRILVILKANKIRFWRVAFRL